MTMLTPTETPGRPQVPRRRYPAGRAIAVVLLSLFLGALFDADSLVASISSERFGTSRSIELALVKPFKAVSDTFGLNLPHRWLADIAGTNQRHFGVGLGQSDQTSSAIQAFLDPGLQRLAALSRQPRRPPGPRTPSAASPVKIWLAGDSMMGNLADSFIAHVTGNPTINASEDVQIGTGLARPDVYDWAGAVAQEMSKPTPQVVVVTFGANDDQDMVAGSQYLIRNSPAWQAEYGRRVGEIMSEVTGAGSLLVWVENPPMARAHLQQTDVIIDQILRVEAASHPGVVLVDPTPVLAPKGSFTTYLPTPGGPPVQVRSNDGVHLTPAGADRVLPLLIQAIRKQWLIS